MKKQQTRIPYKWYPFYILWWMHSLDYWVYFNAHKIINMSVVDLVDDTSSGKKLNSSIMMGGCYKFMISRKIPSKGFETEYLKSKYQFRKQKITYLNWNDNTIFMLDILELKNVNAWWRIRCSFQPGMTSHIENTVYCHICSTYQWEKYLSCWLSLCDFIKLNLLHITTV